MENFYTYSFVFVVVFFALSTLLSFVAVTEDHMVRENIRFLAVFSGMWMFALATTNLIIGLSG